MKEAEKSRRQKGSHPNQYDRATKSTRRVYSLQLPFAGSKGTTTVKNLNKTHENVLPNNVKTRITYTSQKLNSRFQIKDKRNTKHKPDFTYYGKCLELSCTEDCLGETVRRIIERTVNHAGKPKQSHLLKHASVRNYRHVYLSNLKEIDSSFHNNKLKQKISEALYIMQYRPSLNSQEQSVEFSAFLFIKYVQAFHNFVYENIQ